MKLGIVIPARDETDSIGAVIAACRNSLPSQIPCRIVVADNASSDDTARQAQAAGAEVRFVGRRGYGAACLGAIAHLSSWPDVLVFIDGDGSSRPSQIPLLMEPLVQGVADLVVGRRSSDAPMTLPQRWGTRLAVWGINLRWRSDFHDIGPFRAIRRSALQRLGMRDKTWGWTVEMQVLALMRGIRCIEVDVAWDERLAGTSKISGTVSGVVRAGGRIVWTLLRYGLFSRGGVPAAPPRSAVASCSKSD